MDWDKVFTQLKTLNWIILLAMAAVSSLLAKPAFTLGILLGGLMIIANFYFLQRTVRQGFCPDGTFKAKKKSIIVKYYLRLTVMGILIYLLITRELVHPVGLTIGLSTIVISIVGVAIILIWKSSSREAV